MLHLLFRRRRDDSGGRAERRRESGGAAPPPLSPEELNGNLSELEKDLNARMVCPAGKNQVYLRSVIGNGGASKPRIALRCSYRREQGQPAEVYFEHVRDVCACDPEKCEAYRKVRARLANL